MFMTKIVNAIKKPVKKVAVVKEEKEVTVCTDCNGTGLKDAQTICATCAGGGQK